MNNDAAAIIKEFNAIIEAAEIFRYVTRAVELQQESIASLKRLQEKIKNLKIDAIDDGNEKLANVLLGYECVVAVLVAEIEMWILLKQEDPDAAWDRLVVAQRLSLAAVRADVGFGHVVENYRRLEAIEMLVFPRQAFVSSGMIIGQQECSICRQEYEDCEHLVGMPYMGEFCRAISKSVELDHVAIVQHPADKSCRMTEVEVEGGVRNRMTWRVEEKDGENHPVSDGGLRVRATLRTIPEG